MSSEESMQLKLREIFPTIDEDTIGAVLAHHHGDAYAAMLQLIELLGDDEEALEITFALLEAEQLDETTSQMALDEQMALALQQELTMSDGGMQAGSSEGRAARPVSARKKPSPKKGAKLSEEAKQLLVKFGRYRARTGTQRLLDITAPDSAEIDEEPADQTPSRHPYAPSSTSSAELAPADESKSGGIKLGGDDRTQQYNERLQRARLAKQPTQRRDGFSPIEANA